MACMWCHGVKLTTSEQLLKKKNFSVSLKNEPLHEVISYLIGSNTGWQSSMLLPMPNNCVPQAAVPSLLFHEISYQALHPPYHTWELAQDVLLPASQTAWLQINSYRCCFDGWSGRVVLFLLFLGSLGWSLMKNTAFCKSEKLNQDL